MASTHAQQIVQKLWNYCNILRDDGLSYDDYAEQLTTLLFLKMADEQTRPPYSRAPIVPAGWSWAELRRRDGADLEDHYRRTLEALGREPGMLGVVFRKAQNKIQDPAKLRRLIVDLIDRETWVALDADVKGDAYEGLLEKNAQDTKGEPASTSPRARSSARSSRRSARGPARRSATPPRAPAASCSPPTSSWPTPRATSSTATRRRSCVCGRSTASSWWTASPASAP